MNLEVDKPMNLIERLREPSNSGLACKKLVLEAAVELEDEKRRYNWLKSELRENAKIIGNQEDELERMSAERDEYKRQADGYYHEAADALAKVKKFEAKIERLEGALEKIAYTKGFSVMAKECAKEALSEDT